MSKLPAKNFKLLIGSTFLIALGILLRISPKSYAQTTDQKTTQVQAEVTNDHDQDGMPTAWELLQGFDPTDPADAAFDPDNDNATNLQEYLYGIDPFDPDTDKGGLIDGDEILQGKNPLDPSDDEDKYKDPNYRAKPSPKLDKRADSDGDGLSDVQEAKFFTDKHNRDTDSDGIGDFDEIFTYYTDPLNWDTDGDGLLDGEEVFEFETDPKNEDSDYDLLLDGEEVKTYGTSPTLYDTDAGGVGDGDEIFVNRTNALDGSDDFGKIAKKEDVEILYMIGGVDMSEFIDIEKNIELVTDLEFEIYSNYPVEIYFGEFRKITGINAGETAKLKAPSTPTDYELRMKIWPGTTDEISITKTISVKNRGRIYGRATGTFAQWINGWNLGHIGPLENTNVTLYRLNETTNDWELYDETQFSLENPTVTTEGGSYVFVVNPGKYKIQIQKDGRFEDEAILEATKPKILSQNIYLSYNYDVYIWGGIFIIIFNLVLGIELLIQEIILRAVKIHTKSNKRVL